MSSNQSCEKKGPLVNELVQKLIYRTTGVKLKWEDFASEKELMAFFEFAAASMIELESPDSEKLKRTLKEEPQKWQNILMDIGAPKGIIGILQSLLSPYFGPTSGHLCKSRLANFVAGIPAAILMANVISLLSATRQFFQLQALLKKLTERLSNFETQIFRLREITAELEISLVKYAEEKSASYNTPLFQSIEVLFGEAKKIIYGEDLRGQMADLRTDMENARRSNEATKGQLQATAIGSYSAGAGLFLLGLFVPVLLPMAAASFVAGTATGTTFVVFDQQISGELWKVEQELKKLDLYDKELQETIEKIALLEQEHQKVVNKKMKKTEAKEIKMNMLKKAFLSIFDCY